MIQIFALIGLAFFLVSCGKGTGLGFDELTRTGGKGSSPSSPQSESGSTTKSEINSAFEINRLKNDLGITIKAESFLKAKKVTPILSAKINRKEAEAFCKNLNYFGTTQWALPTLAELSELNRLKYYELSEPEAPSFYGTVWPEDAIEERYRTRSYYIGTTQLFASDLDLAYHAFAMGEGEKSAIIADNVLTGTGINEAMAIKDAKESYSKMPNPQKENLIQGISFKTLCIK